MEGLTPRQEIFLATCRRLDVPDEQIAICLSVFSEEELDETIDYTLDKLRANGTMEIWEWMEELTTILLRHGCSARRKAGCVDL